MTLGILCYDVSIYILLRNIVVILRWPIFTGRWPAQRCHIGALTPSVPESAKNFPVYQVLAGFSCQ